MQVLKLWSPRGEMQGVIRATAPFLAQRVGPVNCLAFHPYRLLLASGGGDPIIALYPIVSPRGGDTMSYEHATGSAAAPSPPTAEAASPTLPTDNDSPSNAS